MCDQPIADRCITTISIASTSSTSRCPDGAREFNKQREWARRGGLKTPGWLSGYSPGVGIFLFSSGYERAFPLNDDIFDAAALGYAFDALPSPADSSFAYDGNASLRGV